MTVEIDAYRKVIRSELQAGGKLSKQMKSVIGAVEKDQPHPDWEKFRRIPYDRLAPMRNWLTHRFSKEPPQTPVKGLWFGLCHTRHGGKSADLFLSASTRFSKSDSALHWTIDPEYQPDYCFARSDALWKIYQAAHRKKGGLKQSAERPLCFAYAAFAVAQLMQELDPQLLLNGNRSAGVAVGFAPDEAIQKAKASIEIGERVRERKAKARKEKARRKRNKARRRNNF